MLPDYESGSIINLMSSIRGAFGGPPLEYAPLDQLPATELEAPRNVVLMVLDGLGYKFLQQYGQETAFKPYLRGAITTVFPSTTAAAVTSFVTGLAPQQHGITGWYTYLKEFGAVWAMLPFKPRFIGARIDHNALDPEKLLRLPTFFEGIDAESYVVTPARIMDSDYSRATTRGATSIPYTTLDGFFTAVDATVRKNLNRKYLYAYWPELDSLSHEYGSRSSRVLNHLKQLEAGFKRLLERLEGTDTMLVVTADHGLIDAHANKVVYLEDHPDLQETLLLPLCGEPRAAYCYVRPGKARQFEAYVRGHLSDMCFCYESEELVRQGYFGLHEPNPHLYERIGDYTLLMKDNWVIKDFMPGEEAFSQVGVHGGATEDEMLVPLIVARA